MKLTPFAVIYGGTLNPVAVLSSTKTLVAATIAQLNAAIADINTNFANYGYAATPGIPTIPAIPTPGSTAPQAIAYFQSQGPGATGPSYGPSTSYLLIDAYTANGYSDPSAALDVLTADVTLANITLALAVLSTAAPIAITVQPTNQSIANTAAGAIALTATGAGASFRWFIQKTTDTGFSEITAANNNLGTNSLGAAVFSTINTASLTITRPQLAIYNGSKVKALVQSVSGGQWLSSNTVTLTVT